MVNWPAEIIFVCALLMEPVRMRVPLPAFVKFCVPAIVPPYVSVVPVSTLMVPAPVSVMPLLALRVNVEVLCKVPPLNVI